MSGARSEIPVTRSSMPDFVEYCQEIAGLWDSRMLTNMGAKHRQLQGELAQYLGAEHVDLLANGHMAIEMSLQALGLSGEVITTPFTFASTTHAIVRSGLEPVFCDVEPKNFTMNPQEIERHITKRTTAILPVHVYGALCDIKAIEKIAGQYGLKVIYDAAHAFGARYQGQGAGSFGDVSCFSFHATKVFHTVEGGCACFRDAEFGQRLARIKNFGLAGQESVEEAGGNGKLDEFRAAMGLCNLRHVQEQIAKRRRAAERYRERFLGVPGLQLAAEQKDVESNYAYFPVVFHPEEFGADRDEVLSCLESQGIRARKYFYPLTSAFGCYQGRFDSDKTPVAQGISRRVLTLPLYADLTLEDVDRVCDGVLKIKRRG